MHTPYIRPVALAPHLHSSQSPHHDRRSQRRDHEETPTENQQEDDGADTVVKENPVSPPPAKKKREEVDDFDVDEFLDGLFPPREDEKDQKEKDEAAPLLQNPDTPECPRYHIPLKYHESPQTEPSGGTCVAPRANSSPNAS